MPPEPLQTGSRTRPAALLVSELFPPAVGGTPVLFQAIYSRLDPEVTVLTAGADSSVPEPARRDRLTVVRRLSAAQQWGVLEPAGLSRHLRAAREVRRLTSGRDIVVHCARALPEGVGAWMSRRLGGAPFICWSHGEDVGTARHSREFTLMMRTVYRGAAATIANSRNTGRMLEELGVPPARIHVVYPGVDVERFRPDVDGSAIRARYATGASTVLLSIGRLQRRKGHDVAIRAAARLRGDVPITYLIVGDGDERPRLQALVSELGVADCVHFVGEVTDADLPRWYAACDLFVLPNRDDDGDVEGFGIVFLEAAATCRPAIGGRSGGVAEAIVDRETGLLVGGTDVEELAAAIRRLASSPEQRRSMGAAGRARACRDFTWDRAAAAVGELHAEVGRTSYPAGRS